MSFSDWCSAVQRLLPRGSDISQYDQADLQKVFASGISPVSCANGIKSGVYRKAAPPQPAQMPHQAVAQSLPPATQAARRGFAAILPRPDIDWLLRLHKLFKLAAWTTWLLACGVLIVSALQAYAEIQPAPEKSESATPDRYSQAPSPAYERMERAPAAAPEPAPAPIEDKSTPAQKVAAVARGWLSVGFLFGAAVFIACMGGVWMFLSQLILVLAEMSAKLGP